MYYNNTHRNYIIVQNIILYSYWKKKSFHNVICKLFQCVFLRIAAVIYNKAHYYNNSIKRSPEIYYYIKKNQPLSTSSFSSVMIAEERSTNAQSSIALPDAIPFHPLSPSNTNYSNTTLHPLVYSYPACTFPCHFKLLLAVSYSESFYVHFSNSLYRFMSALSLATRSNHFNLFILALSAVLELVTL